MEIILDGTCHNCPFLSDTFNLCQLVAKLENRLMDSDTNTVDYVYGKGHVQPDWCPIKANSVAIIQPK